MAMILVLMAWSFWLMASFVERKVSNFELTLKFNCKFHVEFCAVMFGSRVSRSLDCRMAAFSDHVKKNVAEPLQLLFMADMSTQGVRTHWKPSVSSLHGLVYFA